ncbi:MAG: hypothetical protein OXG23_14170 [Chloroflexi bacterium]|nr:hypothetical protein [Chloroflexota bacterium]
MTLVIGVKCQDGIVIGADSVTTYGSAIEQEVDDKIKTIDGEVLVASAGDVGLGQIVYGNLEQHWSEVVAGKDIVSTRKEISALVWDEIKPALQRAAEAETLFGRRIVESLACNFMVAFAIDDAHTLLVFDDNAQSLEVTFSSPFFSIGSGNIQADPFLAFVKRIFWKDSTPKTLADGIFCVLWTLDHVSRVNAGLGVGGRPNVVVLQNRENKWRAEKMSDVTLGEQLMGIQNAEDYMGRFRHYYSPGLSNSDKQQ